MYIDSKHVLHVTDVDTGYGAARFVTSDTKNPTTAQVWDAFVPCWSLIYTGMPDCITTDRGTQFTSTEFELYLSHQGIYQRYIAVESHHILGANERAHSTLRRVYLKLVMIILT